MIRNRTPLAIALVLAIAAPEAVFGSPGGTSGAITLLDHGSARASALAEAVSAGADDVTYFAFNPASLGTLQGGQASAFFRRGLEEQSEGRVHIGRPFKRWTGAFSLGFFDGGAFEAVADGESRTVTVQRDLVASAGGAFAFRGVDVGATAKFLSSELLGTETARTVALDAGFQAALRPGFRIGGAVQNIGPGLKYRNERDPLPQIVRGGASLRLPTRRAAATVSLDLPYLVNERDLQTNLGLEMAFGPLAVRAGVARRFGELQWSIGTGIGLGQFTLDYGMAMFDQLSAKHQFSLSMRFDPAGGRAEIVKAAPAAGRRVTRQEAPARRHTLESANRPSVVAVTDAPKDRDRSGQIRRRVYIVKKGDTLATISKKTYGRIDMWRQIFSANAHVLKDPDDLTEGQKIVLPPTSR